jgi:hypothetical protein
MTTRSVLYRRQPPAVRLPGGTINMSRRKPLAALTAVTAALSLAVPVASASATMNTAAVRTVSTTAVGGHHAVSHARSKSLFLGSGSILCQLLVGQLILARASGNTLLANALGTTLIYLCPTPAI